MLLPIIISLVLIQSCTPAFAGWVDTGIKGENSASTVVSTTITLSGVTTGQFVVVGWSMNRASTTPTCPISDDKGSNYTGSVTVKYTSPQGACTAYATLAGSGTVVITIGGNGSNSYDFYGAAHVFTGQHSSPASGTPVTASGTASTAPDTGSFTPNDSDALYIALEGNSQGGTITTNVSPGDTNWTESNQNAVSGRSGSLVYYIASGAATSRRAVWTTGSGTWAAIIQAFKPKLFGGNMSLLGVQ